MLNKIIEKTNQYIQTMPKEERKKYGQFFTSKETAEFMASLYDVPENITSINILDAGAGSGILSCAVIVRLNVLKNLQQINLTCYETDLKILDLLQENLEYLKQNIKKKLNIQIITKNYITSQEEKFDLFMEKNSILSKYDMVIGNPPYRKLPKTAPEVAVMSKICYGTPNLYFLFAAMSLFHLKKNGEMVYIIPRSWTSGAYFKKFRQYLLTEGKLQHIHLFISRNKVFEKENVLQETMIIKIKKSHKPHDTITITSSNSNQDFKENTFLKVPYHLVVSREDLFVYLVTNKEEEAILKKVLRFQYTLPKLGLKMKTGLTVDFRNQEMLRNEEEDGAVPLFYSQHIKNGQIVFPIQKEKEYIVTKQNGLLQENKNYLFVKRFTTKEEPRRLQCGIYLAKNYPQYSKISTQNKINFIDGAVGEMSECLVYGLYVLFHSSIYDKYYRMLNGSTQVNATEINTMPIPDLQSIKDMGKKLMQTKDLSENNCNIILEGYFE